MARKEKKEAPEKVESPKVTAKAEVKETVVPRKEGPTQKVKVTQEELMRLQDERRLIGYDPLTCEATIR